MSCRHLTPFYDCSIKHQLRMTFVQIARNRQEEGLWQTITIRAPQDGDCCHYIFGRWINTCIYWTTRVSSACLFSPVALSWGTGINTLFSCMLKKPSLVNPHVLTDADAEWRHCTANSDTLNVNRLQYESCLFVLFLFFFNPVSSDYSSPDAVAYERCEVWIRYT